MKNPKITMIDLYTFQRWNDIQAAFEQSGSYTPSWTLAHRQTILNDGEEWWGFLAPAYRWVMSEMEAAGMPSPGPDAAPVWAWARWIDNHGRIRTRPDRRCSDFHGQYDGLELIHLHVDKSRVLLTDFDSYHCVLNKAPCAPESMFVTGLEDEYDEWLDVHWDDPIDAKRRQWHDSVIIPLENMPRQWIQACLWTIHPQDVVRVLRRRRPRSGTPHC
ncbi:hypothetical protein D2E25_1638 [Bifidobacterium goeldii]|uniref:DUF3841 domain-containing protein n=1 Tax=Bifidobacterium goeldii TaxID=2306975 RepID=A0A430FH39_9BIFI|nr:DUF3841 domain-containing protein [Bifidobacterium goeldii]RSX52225.1 hypothetical protein D2E25_1638 [Bifidobacterium goeldii]